MSLSIIIRLNTPGAGRAWLTRGFHAGGRGATRKIKVISGREWTGQVIKGQLQTFFGDLVSVDRIFIEHGVGSLIGADLVIISNATVLRDIGRHACGGLRSGC